MDGPLEKILKCASYVRGMGGARLHLAASIHEGEDRGDGLRVGRPPHPTDTASSNIDIQRAHLKSLYIAPRKSACGGLYGGGYEVLGGHTSSFSAVTPLCTCSHLPQLRGQEMSGIGGAVTNPFGAALRLSFLCC